MLNLLVNNNWTFVTLWSPLKVIQQQLTEQWKSVMELKPKVPRKVVLAITYWKLQRFSELLEVARDIWGKNLFLTVPGKEILFHNHFLYLRSRIEFMLAVLASSNFILCSILQARHRNSLRLHYLALIEGNKNYCEVVHI